jgi:hypothetical protein
MKNEEQKLVEFFRTEGSWLGNIGDDHHWSPAETAIQCMRELLKVDSFPYISQIPSPNLISPQPTVTLPTNEST